MGEALLSRLIAQQIYQPTEVLVSEPLLERRSFLSHQYGVQAVAENRLVLEATEVLFLAIKPQIFQPVIASLADTPDALRIDHPLLIISILAGVGLQRLEAAFPDSAVIRAMPNTPATVGAGITAISLGQQVTPEHHALAQRIFQTLGAVVDVPEHLMDAVTALSGSGPGYVAIVVEALTDGGVAVGLPRAIAAKLALQTVLGTAQLLDATDMHPAELKDRVTSPGGTTIAGIAQLEQAGLRAALIAAVRAAWARSQELGT
jgi:pyrroline-5-carboxylate reductase